MPLSAEEERTLRLYNVGNTQLSFHLHRLSPKTAIRLRRGLTLTPIAIMPGQFKDVCKELAVDYAEAVRIVAQSPEAQAFKNSGRLLIREHPPLPETLEKEAVVAETVKKARAQDAALNPPDPPNALPAGVHRVREEVGLDPEAPRMTRASTEKVETPAAAEEITKDDKPAAVEATLRPPEEAKAADEDDDREPSMDWTEKKLREFAEARGFDLKRARSKTAILKKIREAMKKQ
jgi:hypothetical protein